jgi:hypothetical protein
MGEHERRVGLNEAVFREVNERLRDLNLTFTTLSERMDLICECSDTSCAAHLSMSPAEYDALRADARRFVVVPGHEDRPHVERVVEEHEGYNVVEKRGDAASTAEQTDPREHD